MCSWATRSRRCRTPNSPRWWMERRCSPGCRRRTSNASSKRCRAKATSWAAWATVSTMTRPWPMSQITRFILFIGPCSSVFDYTTYLLMLFAFGCWADWHAAPTEEMRKAVEHLFQTGWFVESLLTQTLIIHVIRTNRIPFLQSRPSLPLVFTSVIVMAFGAWLPYSPFAAALGFVELPALYRPIRLLTLIGYITLTQGVT